MWEYITYFFENIVTALKDFGLWLLDLVYGLFKSVGYWLFDQLCTLVEWVFALIDFKNELFDTALVWSNFPSELIWICNTVGLDNGFIIVSAALGIRVLLNLIPTWATRV